MNKTLTLDLFCSRPVLQLFIRTLSSTSNDRPLTVSYLINTCGLSPQAALSASGKVSFESTENPDSVIRFLKLQGFSKTHISKFVSRWPKCLLANPEKTLLPKFEFFISKGFSRPQLVKCTSAFPFFMRRSLKKVIVPNFEYVKNILGTDERTVVAIRRDLRILCHDAHCFLAPNIHIMRSNGVPESKIAYMLYACPSVLSIDHEKFEKLVGEVKNMGLNPAKSVFVLAIDVKSMKKSTWERKVNAYKRWGWTEDAILEAFRKQPLCMKISENNITESMDFFVNQLGLDSLSIAKRPDFLMCDLKKKIIPRAAVVKLLLLKGIIKKDVSYFDVAKLTESKFLEKFVNIHREAPELLQLYNEKMSMSN